MNEGNSNKVVEILQKIWQFIVVLLNVIGLLRRIRSARRARKVRRYANKHGQIKNDQKEGEQ